MCKYCGRTVLLFHTLTSLDLYFASKRMKQRRINCLSHINAPTLFPLILLYISIGSAQMLTHTQREDHFLGLDYEKAEPCITLLISSIRFRSHKDTNNNNQEQRKERSKYRVYHWMCLSVLFSHCVSRCRGYFGE